MGKFILEKDHKKLQGPIKDTRDTKAQELPGSEKWPDYYCILCHLSHTASI